MNINMSRERTIRWLGMWPAIGNTESLMWASPHVYSGRLVTVHSSLSLSNHDRFLYSGNATYATNHHIQHSLAVHEVAIFLLLLPIYEPRFSTATAAMLRVNVALIFFRLHAPCLFFVLFPFACVRRHRVRPSTQHLLSSAYFSLRSALSSFPSYFLFLLFYCNLLIFSGRGLSWIYANGRNSTDGGQSPRGLIQAIYKP